MSKKFTEQYFFWLSWSAFILAQDNAIIAIGFGQLVLEGKIDEDLRSLTKIAIERQLLPVILSNWDDHKIERENKLQKMLSVVENM